MDNIIKIQAKTILSAVKNAPDPYFGSYYNMNLYRGCQHGCIYCDTRSSCYGIGDLSNIRIKENAMDLLKSELKKKKKKGTITFGSMNDPYMPIEKEIMLARKALKLIARFKFGVHIITKSDLVVRDIDLLKEISKVYTAVSFTITTIDDTLAEKIEPNAPASSKRFNAIKELSSNGIYAGITLMPTLPYLTDSVENIVSIVKKAKQCGVKYILFWPGMTLRDFCRDYYYKKLDENFPGLKQKYIQSYGNRYGCDSLNAKKLKQAFYAECKKRGIATKIKIYKENPKKTQTKLF